MLGKRVSPAGKKLDVVIEAARYTPDGARLVVGRGYERRGAVWSDVLLFDREQLMRRVKSGARVVVGKLSGMPGDFDVVAPLHVRESNGTEVFVAEGQSDPGDSLGVPWF